MSESPDPEFHLAIRPGKPEDVAYVLSCWLAGIFKGSYWGVRLSREIFNANHRPQVARILQRAAVYVAHPEDDPDTILGFIVAEAPASNGKPIVHWLYARESWRRIGIAKRLLNLLGIDPNNCTFPTWAFDCNWLICKYPGATFNPYLQFI